MEGVAVYGEVGAVGVWGGWDGLGPKGGRGRESRGGVLWWESREVWGGISRSHLIELPPSLQVYQKILIGFYNGGL